MENETETNKIKEMIKNSSRKERKEARRVIYEQIKATKEAMSAEDLTAEEYQRYSATLKNLVEAYELLQKPKEMPRWVDTGIKVVATAATIVGTAVVKEKLLDSGGLTKSTEGIFNNSTKLLN